MHTPTGGPEGPTTEQVDADIGDDSYQLSDALQPEVTGRWRSLSLSLSFCDSEGSPLHF